MKIIQLIQKPQLRGAEIFACQLSNHLESRGHEVLMVSIFKGDSELPYSNCIHLARPLSKRLFDIYGWKTFSDIVREFNPDIIQANAADTLKFVTSAKLIFKFQGKLIFRNANKMGDFITNALKHKLNSFYIKQLDYVISVSKECEKDFVRTFNFDSSSIETITIGVEEKVLNGIPEDLKEIFAEGPVLTHIGGFVPEKNHAGLLRIFEEIVKHISNVQLLLIGKGGLQADISHYVKSKGLEKNVHFLNYRTDVLDILKHSNLFVLPSLIEGLPAVILEAMYCGSPVVAYNVGGIGEVVKDNQTGILIEKNDEKCFIRKSIELLQNVAQQEELKNRAKSFVDSNFTNSKIATEFENCYQKIKIEKNQRSNSSLRILQIIQKKQYRGAEIFCCQLSNELLEQGHEVEMYSIFDGNAELPFKKEIKVIEGRKDYRYLDSQGWRHIHEIIKDFKPDLVQANAADTLKYTVFSKKIFGWVQPIVYRNASVSSFYIDNFFSKQINNAFLQNISLIISVSKFSKRDLNRLFPFTVTNSEVIPIGVVTDDYKNLESPYSENGKNILHVGSFTKEKNHSKLLKIFKICLERNNNLKLHLLGDGPLRNEIINEINQLQINDKVVLYGEVKFPQNYIKYADVLVLPSLIEGLPGIVLEAMFCKTPVIASDVGGISEILNEETGFIIKDNETSSFVEVLLEILEKFPTSKVTCAHKMVLENYSIKDISKKFIDKYQRLLSK